MLKQLKSKKSFTDEEKKHYCVKYPQVDTAECWCLKRHKSGCGYITNQFIILARSRFFRAMCDAKTKFIAHMNALCHHARNEHVWEGGQCDFHPLRLCSCGQCSDGDLRCKRKGYETRNVVTCLFHGLAYQIECDRRAERAHDIIHPVLGRGHTNQIETKILLVHLSPPPKQAQHVLPQVPLVRGGDVAQTQ